MLQSLVEVYGVLLWKLAIATGFGGLMWTLLECFEPCGNRWKSIGAYGSSWKLEASTENVVLEASF